MSDANQTTPSGSEGSNSAQGPAQSNQAQRNSSNSRRNNAGSNGGDFSHRHFKGSTPEIGATLSLPNERVSTDKGFEFFQDELETYVLKTLPNAVDVISIITDLVDPAEDFLKKMPKPVFTEQEASQDAMKKAVNDQMAKQFAQRIGILQTNTARIYGLVWGQCTNALVAEIKSQKDYDTNAASYNALRLLGAVKKLSSGVATRGNKYANMANVLRHFMRFDEFLEA